MEQVPTLFLVVSSVAIGFMGAAFAYWVQKRELDDVLGWIAVGLLAGSGWLFVRVEGWLFLVTYIPFCVIGTYLVTMQENYEGHYQLPSVVSVWLIALGLALFFFRHLNTVAWTLGIICVALNLTTLCLKPRGRTRLPATTPDKAAPAQPVKHRRQRGASSRH